MSSSLTKQQIDVVIPVYNGAACILDTLKTVFAQVLPDGWTLQVYVVDDASTDDTQERVRKAYPQVQLVALSQNQGRSIARNQGAATGQGELLCFLDSDCQYQGSQALAAYIQVLNAGADVSFGSLHTDTPGFWGQYQQAVFARRIAEARQGNMQVMTSANFALRRSVFEKVQGFFIQTIPIMVLKIMICSSACSTQATRYSFVQALSRATRMMTPWARCVTN